MCPIYQSCNAAYQLPTVPSFEPIHKFTIYDYTAPTRFEYEAKKQTTTMHLTSLFTLTALTALVSSSPTPIQHAARSCTIKLPSTYQQIEEATPSTAYPQGRQFLVSRTASPGNDVDTLVHFTGIPTGSYGCQLDVSFFPAFTISSTGASTQLNVFKLGNNITVDSTYADYFPSGGSGSPVNSTLFGTITLEGMGQKAVINSAVCTPDMSFLFEIANQGAGNVSFFDQGDNLTGIAGFYLNYDC